MLVLFRINYRSNFGQLQKQFFALFSIYLRSAEVVHGDICERNGFIDFGEVAPGYQNDVVDVGRFQWCTHRLPEGERDKVSRAAGELIEKEDVHSALAMLEELKELQCRGMLCGSV